MQEAAVTALRFGDEYYRQLLDTYTHKRALFLKGLDDLRLPHTTPQGAYYVLLDISEFGYDSDLAFCEALARDVGVGAVPGSSFFREPVHHLIPAAFRQKGRNAVRGPRPPPPACVGSSSPKNKIRALRRENQSARRLPCGLVCFYAANRRRYGRPRQPVNTGRERPAG